MIRACPCLANHDLDVLNEIRMMFQSSAVMIAIRGSRMRLCRVGLKVSRFEKTKTPHVTYEKIKKTEHFLMLRLSAKKT